jgi:hypothetical protein
MDRDLRLVWLYCVIEDAVRQILGETHGCPARCLLV